MRFFIALEIPESNKDEIKLLQQSIKELIPDIRITDSEKLHLTLAFVGDQNQDLKNDLIDLVTQSTSGISPFTLTPGFIDGFPTLHHPEVLWIGVKGDVDKLYILRERIKDGLVKINLDIDERRFIPHIAIGKSKNLHLTEDAERQLENFMLKNFSEIPITSIKLYESVPSGDFHIHNTLAEIKLI